MHEEVCRIDISEESVVATSLTVRKEQRWCNGHWRRVGYARRERKRTRGKRKEIV